MDIPIQYIIHDIRSSKDFKGITICGYKRRDVINAFQNSMINNKLEDSIRWCVELHSTGLNKIIWTGLKTIYFKYIHVNNPKYFIYLLKREEDFLNIIKKYPKQHEIFSRNDQEIRNLYAELVAISCLTKKNNIFLPKSLPKINQKSFENADIKKRMISRNLEKIYKFITNTTTSEMKLALNEIYSNLLWRKGTFQNCIYWYLWLEKIVKKPHDDWIAILWKIIFRFGLDERYIKKLYKSYSLTKNKHIFFIIFYIIKNSINWNIHLFQQEHLIIQANANINRMYENIINNIEGRLSNEQKEILRKNYEKKESSLIKPERLPKKIINTQIDENSDINVVELTNYPDYQDISKDLSRDLSRDLSKDLSKDLSGSSSKNLSNETPNFKNKPNKPIKEELVYKNMTEKDIKAQKDEMKNKKLDIFTQMITYKKKDIKKSVSFEDSPSITNNSVISFFVAPNDGLEVLDGPTGSLRPDGSAISEDIKEEIEYKNINFSKKK